MHGALQDIDCHLADPPLVETLESALPGHVSRVAFCEVELTNISASFRKIKEECDEFELD